MGVLSDLFVALEEGFESISKRFFEAVGSHKPDYKNNYIIPASKYIGHKLQRVKLKVLDFYLDTDLPAYRTHVMEVASEVCTTRTFYS